MFHNILPSMSLSSTRLNVLFAFILQVIEKGAGYIVLAVLTRTLLQEEIGGMFFAVSVSRLAAVTLNLGTDSLLIRKVASDPPNSLRYLSQNLSLRVLSMTVGYLLLNSMFWYFRPDLAFVMILVSTATFLDDVYTAFASFFAGKKKIIYRLGILGSFKVVGILLISVTAYITRSLMLVLTCQVLLSLLIVLSSFIITRRAFGRVELKWEPYVKLEWIRQSFPFWAVNLLGLMHMRFDTIMIGSMLDLQRVALYEIGIKLLEVARFMVRPFRIAMLPVFSEYLTNGDWDRLKRRFWQLMLLAFGLGGLMLAGMLSLGSPVIPFLFGESYRESVEVTKILFISVPFLFAGFLANIIASAFHLERQVLWITAIALFMNIGLNIFIIPIYEIAGAAWVTVASQFFLTAGMLWIVMKKLFASSTDLKTASDILETDQP